MVEDVELFDYYDEEEQLTQDRIIEKERKTRKVFKQWNSCLKGTSLRSHWDELLKEHEDDEGASMDEEAFNTCLKTFLKEELPNNAETIVLDCVKGTRKPPHLSCRRWLLLLKEQNELRAKIDPRAKFITNEQMIRERMIPKMARKQIKDFVKDRHDARKCLQEAKEVLENCERVEKCMKKSKVFENKGKGDGEFRRNNRRNARREHGNHDWKDCPGNTRSKNDCNENESRKNEEIDNESRSGCWSK